MLFVPMRPFLPYYALVETYEFYHLRLYKPSYPQTTLVHNEVPKTHQGFHLDFKFIANIMNATRYNESYVLNKLVPLQLDASEMVLRGQFVDSPILVLASILLLAYDL